MEEENIFKTAGEKAVNQFLSDTGSDLPVGKFFIAAEAITPEGERVLYTASRFD